MIFKEELEGLNDKLQDLSLTQDFNVYLRWGTEGYVDFVDLLLDNVEINIWNSEDDRRKFHEDTNEYEPLRDFIITELLKILFKLQTVTLALKK